MLSQQDSNPKYTFVCLFFLIALNVRINIDMAIRQHWEERRTVTQYSQICWVKKLRVQSVKWRSYLRLSKLHEA